jgi:hypothetical protein
LISSARRKWVKIGPFRNSKRPWRWSKRKVPVMSLGRRSGVNWMRLKAQIEGLREEAGDERLGQPRIVLDQDVPIGETPARICSSTVALPTMVSPSAARML